MALSLLTPPSSLLQSQFLALPLRHPIPTHSLSWISGRALGQTLSSSSARVKRKEVSKNLSVRAGMLEDVANTKIPSKERQDILAFVAKPNLIDNAGKLLPVVILIHEFYGLTPEICGKADAIAKEVGCIVVAPDTCRGQSTRFIPKAIYLALGTPQDRVDADLDDVMAWASALTDADTSRVALMGFCYGGGKALAYSTRYKKAKATIVVYGKPILDSSLLQNIQGRVLGIYGDLDSQFPERMVTEFQEALNKAGVANTISIYKDQGHAFWTNMDQIHVDGPQRKAWKEVTTFLSEALTSSEGGAAISKPKPKKETPSNLKASDGVVIVDHGSRRPQSNEMLHSFVELYKNKTGHGIVEAAHMELAEPSISVAFDRCVEQGAKRVIICPYFFFPGRHWDRDIPALSAKAAENHPSVPYLVTAPIGLQERMVDVLVDRMDYCLSRVAGDVGECDMCRGTGRCQQLVGAATSSEFTANLSTWI